MKYIPVWEQIMEETYNIYHDKNPDISFDDFFDKVIKDPKFGVYYDNVLWEQAKENIIVKRKNNGKV